MKTFFATFGVNGPFRTKFVGIIAIDADAARAAMFSMFDNKWGFVYPVFHEIEEHSLVKQIEKYRLSPLFHVRVITYDHHELKVDVKMSCENEFIKAMNKECGETAVIDAVGISHPVIAQEV